jgi:hypothetical protein
MNYLQIVNKVLRRLRETEVTSVEQTKYSKLIGQLVNTTKSEVEKAWGWQHLRGTATVNTAPGTFRYSIPDVEQGFVLLDVINDSQNYFLKQATSREMNEWYLIDTPQTGEITHFHINGYDNNGNPVVDFYPIPDTAQVIHFNVIAPQGELEENTDTPYVPWELLYLGAYARAVEERGEDGATSASRAFVEYQSRMSDFIANEANQYPEEITWSAV